MERRGSSLTGRLTIALALIAFAALRAVAFFHYRFDSDEPQHLHVAWTWSAGLLPYRDQFDNHMPFFHWLTAPILSWFGERADIGYCMRAPMLLIWLATLLCTFILARRAFSPRVAVWATAFLAAEPTFFLRSLEYRTDNLWTLLWLLSLVALTDPRRRTSMTVLAGFLFGLTWITSMKTSLLTITMLIASMAALLSSRPIVPLRRIALRAVLFFAAMAIPPLIVLLYFHQHGALGDFYFATIGFNALVSTNRSAGAILRIAYGLLTAAALFFAFKTGREKTEREMLVTFLAAVALAYIVSLTMLWPVITDRDQLAVLPLLCTFLAAILIHTLNGQRHLQWAGGALLVIALTIAAIQGRVWQRQNDEAIALERHVLQLTHPGEWLMDYKGETIFRRRPSKYILEFITRRAMAEQKLPNTILADITSQQCYVTQSAGPFFPPDVRDFLHAYFLDVGRLRVAGQFVSDDGYFVIVVPGLYDVVNEGGRSLGLLDGSPFIQPRHLAVGMHRFTGNDRRVAAVWAPAIERGFSPFHLRR